MMTLDELSDLLDRQGPHRDAWPPAERAAAEALLAGSAEARRLLAEAEGLDRALAAELGRGRAGLELRAKVLRIASQRRTAAPPWAALPQPWRGAVAAAASFAMAASLAFGIVVGVADSDASADVAPHPDLLWTVVYGPSDPGALP